MDILLKDSRFYAAVVALINVVLLYFVPTFPKEVWAAVDLLACIIIGALTARSTVTKVATRNLAAKQAARVPAI
jgi:hypothetical protein